jgi:glycosyltransferase involved in cell wall biosynthesis
MATFNGEAHLREQLDSLAAQEFLPHELVVGDDGSSDGTLDILDAFARESPFPVTVNQNAKNLGFSDNFLQTAAECRGDWIAFCDQDDVWLPNKLGACAEGIKNQPDANLVLQFAEICDADLKKSGRKFPNVVRPGFYAARQQYGFWVWLGFLQTVKGELIRKLSFADRPLNYFRDHGTQSHDKWTCMIANALGGILVIDGISALYRRHDKAVTGKYAEKSIGERIERARRTGARYYRYLSEVADSSSETLDELARNTQDQRWRESFTVSALQFKRLSDAQLTRSKLYSDAKIAKRARLFATLWLDGCYIGEKFHAMGFRSAIKDASVVVLGSPFQETD